MKRTKMTRKGIFTVALMLSLLAWSGNTCHALACESETSNARNDDVQNSKNSHHSSTINEIAKNVGLFDGVDSDVSTNDHVNTDVNLPINVGGNSHNESTDNGIHVNNDSSKNVTKVYNSTNIYNSYSNSVVTNDRSNGEKGGSNSSSTQSGNSSHRKASRDTSQRSQEKKSIGRALTEAATTVVENIADADVPLGNDYLSSGWEQVGHEDATCTEDGYTNYYNPETKELETVVEKSKGHEYVTETIDGGLFHPDTIRTYCSHCQDTISTAEEPNHDEISLAGIFGGIVTVGGALLHKKR